jgi:hypothetical protein
MELSVDGWEKMELRCSSGSYSAIGRVSGSYEECGNRQRTGVECIPRIERGRRHMDGRKAEFCRNRNLRVCVLGVLGTRQSHFAGLLIYGVGRG